MVTGHHRQAGAWTWSKARGVLLGTSGHSDGPAVLRTLHLSCWGPPLFLLFPLPGKLPVINVAEVSLLRAQRNFCISCTSQFGLSSFLEASPLETSVSALRPQCMCLLQGRGYDNHHESHGVNANSSFVK